MGGKRIAIAACALASLCLFLPVSAQGPGDPIDVADRLQLFVDDYLISGFNGAKLKMHPPQRREVVLVLDKAWEKGQVAYFTVLKDGGTYRMYYRGGGGDATPWEVTCMATSTDGATWTRYTGGLNFTDPTTGTVYTGTNIIKMHGSMQKYWECHNFTPMADLSPDTTAAERYKAVGQGNYTSGRALDSYVSSNAINWTFKGTIITEGSFDSQNTSFWDPYRGIYVCYLRQGRTVDGTSYRSVKRSTSCDFVNWSAPDWIDFGGAPWDQLYTNGIAPYARAPQIYLGFPQRFVPSRTSVGYPARTVDALSDGMIMSSHDGVNFSRPFMEAFIRPGLDPDNWGSGHVNNVPSWGILQTSTNEVSIYWTENFGTGNPADTTTYIPQIRRGTVRTDGFVSVNAPYAGGEFVTKPLIFDGKKLVMNFSTSAVGSVKVEIQDASGVPIPGYTLADSEEIWGDELERTIYWGGSSSVKNLRGQTVKLRFVLKDADLYSIRFAN